MNWVFIMMCRVCRDVVLSLEVDVVRTGHLVDCGGAGPSWAG